MARMTTISPEICSSSQHCDMEGGLEFTYSREAVHCICSSDAASRNLMRNHCAETDGHGNPRESCICCPAVEQIANPGIDEADAKRPEAHLGLFDTAVTSSEEDDNSVCEDSGEVSEDTPDEGREEHKTCGSCGKVVGFVGHDFGDCKEVSRYFGVY